jgi:secondary thiamine-phosphate synthase enzyme
LEISITTNEKRQIIDITDLVEQKLDEKSGVINIFAKHTTAAITVADLDPGTDKDILEAIDKITPEGEWQHPHNQQHFPDHLWSSLIGPSQLVPYKEGCMVLGSWQRIIFIELDGPRERQIELTMISS